MPFVDPYDPFAGLAPVLIPDPGSTPSTAPAPAPMPAPTPSPYVPSTPPVPGSVPTSSAPPLPPPTAPPPPNAPSAPAPSPGAGATPLATTPVPGAFMTAAPTLTHGSPQGPSPGAPVQPFVPPPRPAAAGSGGETPAGAANQAQPGLQELGPRPSVVAVQDPRSVLAGLYISRGVDPNNPAGPLGSLGNVDYFVGRMQDTGGWQGGNISYWKNRLGQEIDLNQQGLGAQPEQNRSLIGAGLGNQPGAYFPSAPQQDELAARTRGKLLDLLRGPGDAYPADQARQILEPEQRYAASTRTAALGVGPGPSGPEGGSLQTALSRARLRGDWATVARLQRLAAGSREAVLSGLGAGV